jgi:hypothetical protein
MNRSKLLTAFVLAILPAIAGCGIGKTRVLFVTKTNAGLDVSTQPPTAELSISRVEGVVGPQFANGKKLPVMASFKFENTGIFSPHVGSAFATGDAAVTMAGLYGDDTFGPNWEARADLLTEKNAETTPTNSVLKLDGEPEPGRWLPLLPDWDWLNPKLKYQENDVRPVFFGTDTAFGVKVAWSGMTGQFPDTAKLGYNRKELALVPISMESPTTINEPWKMKMSSLLATLDSGVTASGAANLDAAYIQYFATGNAATLLAMQQDVRKSMLARFDPNKEAYKAQFGDVFEVKSDISLRAEIVMVKIYEGLKGLAEEGDKQAAIHVAALDALGELAPLEFTRYDNTAPPELALAPIKESLRPPNTFTSFADYSVSLRSSINVLNRAIAKGTFPYKAGAGPPTEVTPEQLSRLKEILTLHTTLQGDLAREVSRNKAAVAAVNYYTGLLTK